MILWRVEGEDLHWLSADNVAVVTRQGRVVKTAGLPVGMRDTLFHQPDPIASRLERPKNDKMFIREVRFDRGSPIADDQPSEALIESEFQEMGRSLIEIVEIEFETVLFRERNHVRGINWSFDNWFWVDPADGFVWRSEQTIARTFPPIRIEILKPAA
jgi:hypothetical protein